MSWGKRVAIRANYQKNSVKLPHLRFAWFNRDWTQTPSYVRIDIASVSTSEALMKFRTRYIGVVKNAVREFPMQYLSPREITQRVDHISTAWQNLDTNNSLMAVLWMDREWRYFKSRCHTTNRGTAIFRGRWKPVKGEDKEIVLWDCVSRCYRKVLRNFFSNRSSQQMWAKRHWNWEERGGERLVAPDRFLSPVNHNSSLMATL